MASVSPRRAARELRLSACCRSAIYGIDNQDVACGPRVPRRCSAQRRSAQRRASVVAGAELLLHGALQAAEPVGDAELERGRVVHTGRIRA
jgi:hypothetical protein